MVLPESFKEGKGSLEANLQNVVVIGCQSGEFCGVLAGMDNSAGEVYLFPYLDWSADKKRAFIVDDKVLIIGMGNFNKERPYAIIPKPKGYMDEIVVNSQRKVSLGF